MPFRTLRFDVDLVFDSESMLGHPKMCFLRLSVLLLKESFNLCCSDYSPKVLALD